MHANEPAILADGLTRRFGATTGLDAFDLVVPPGTVHGLLGPNGAGKTTAVRILTTLLRPHAGHARVAGHDLARHPERVRARIGLVGQSAAVDEQLDGRQNLEMLAGCTTSAPGRPAAGPPSCSTGSAWPAAAASRSRSTPAACDGASTWRPACSPARRCSSSTSRPPASTHADAPRSGA